MSLGLSPATRERTSGRSLKKSAASKTLQFQWLAVPDGSRLVVTRMGNGSISEFHTGRMPARMAPSSKPPLPENRLPSLICSIICHLRIRDFLIPAQDKHTRVPIFTDVAPDDDVDELLVQLDAVTDAARLLAGHERRTGTE